MNTLDNFLDKITMYRLVLYELIIYLSIATIFSFFGILHFSPLTIPLTAIFLSAVCLITNEIFARVFKAPTNIESAYITALILACIITPVSSIHDLPLLGWAGVLAMASKYIFSIRKKHLFNPAAIAVVITAFVLNNSASWWIGTFSMTPFIIIGGYLIIRKIEREDLAISFLLTTLSIITFSTILGGQNLQLILTQAILHSPLFFFATVMLTEPLTTPPTKKLRVLYGILVGILFSPEIHIANFYFTPELSLIIGNVFSYIVSPKGRLLLTLKEKLQVSPDTFDFVFSPTPIQSGPKRTFTFTPGQYMEWTLSHSKTDSRGNRRYFTLASAPTEDSIRLGVKFYEKGSSFKRALQTLDNKHMITAGQLAGDFTLPKDKSKKLAFIAGGIGITPFRSMIKFLIDMKQKWDIVLLSANKSYADIVYSDVFSEAQNELGIKTVYTLTDEKTIPKDWNGEVGRISADMIRRQIPDFMERTYYISGPHTMIEAYKEVLQHMGIPRSHMKIDFFPGYA